MRDVHRMKEKYELSLDNRQIISLTIGGLVMVGAVFVLGVVVGKKLGVEEHTVQPPDLLSALDRRAAGIDSVQKDASLTFQDELTKKPEPLVEIQAIEAPAAKAVESPKPVEPPKLEAAKVEALPAVVKPTEAAAKAEAVPTRINQDAGALRDAIARAQKQSPTETSPDGIFTLQLSAYQDRVEADRFAASLRDKGYAPFIVEASLPGKGTWYRVRMGRFPTRDAAARYLSDFKRETSIDAIVTGAN
jgi:DedD protein